MESHTATPAAPTVATLRDGDDGLLSELVGRWYGSSVRLARVLGADEPAAHRAAHDGWLDVIGRLTELDGDRPFHVAVLGSTVESLAAQPVVGDPDPAVDAASFEAEGHRWSGWWRDEKAPKAWEEQPKDEELEQALAELDPPAAAVVVLRDVEGLTAADVASVSGLAPADQRRFLHYGRLAIVSALATKLTSGV